MPVQEPIFDVAHISHVELLTPTLDESVGFFGVDSGRMRIPEHPPTSDALP
jgi:hypothetical protein